MCIDCIRKYVKKKSLYDYMAVYAYGNYTKQFVFSFYKSFTYQKIIQSNSRVMQFFLISKKNAIQTHEICIHF